jgi:hypothetical protein
MDGGCGRVQSELRSITPTTARWWWLLWRCSNCGTLAARWLRLVAGCAGGCCPRSRESVDSGDHVTLRALVVRVSRMLRWWLRLGFTRSRAGDLLRSPSAKPEATGTGGNAIGPSNQCL